MEIMNVEIMENLDNDNVGNKNVIINNKSDNKTNNSLISLKKNVKLPSNYKRNLTLKEQKDYVKELYKLNQSDLLREDLSYSRLKVSNFEIPNEYDIVSLIKYNYSKLQIVEICKHYGIKSTGKKATLLMNLCIMWKLKRKANIIQTQVRKFLSKIYITKHLPCIKIQKQLRGFIVRNNMNKIDYLMYPSKREICKNNVDVGSYDDIVDIDYKDLFFYKEPDTNNYYAFEIATLKRMKDDFRRTRRFNNPWNRKPIMTYYNNELSLNEYLKQQEEQQEDIKYFLGYRNKPSKTRISLIKSLKQKLTENILTQNKNNKKKKRRRRNRNRFRSISSSNEIIANNFIQFEHLNINNPFFDDIINNINRLTTFESINNFITLQLREIFMEIDLLGNYSDFSWFDNMSRRQQNLFCIELFDLWNNRLPFTRTTRLEYIPNIQNGNPFLVFDGSTYRTTLRNFGMLNNLTAKFALMLILKLFIFGSDDREKRIQCSMYVLGCLTICSSEARTALRWLYESFI